MKIIADLHLHSRYSRAVSSKMIPKTIAAWSADKGVDLVGTADWTNPLWLKELEASLKEAGKGIYSLKTGDSSLKKVNFILSTEISSIYTQDNQTRKIHNLIIAPSFKTVKEINSQLKKQGCNLMSDGRPIIGLSSIELAELVWSVDKNCLIIPAHIWTPWFSMFGSKSGFDSIKECWGQFADRIYAIETGLSSDPAMNWRIKELDTRSIVSFSDAHSPAKLAREVTVFDLQELSFANITKALKNNRSEGENKILYTLEFYPEEGKYHYSGHRKCNIRQSPEETRKKGTTCPVCGKPLTLGVMHRVEQLADKQLKAVKKENKIGLVGWYHPSDKKRPPFVKLVPLMEIVAESLGFTTASKKVKNEYKNLTKNLAPELKLLTQTKIEDIENFAGQKTAQTIKKLRTGAIIVEPGYDGVYGQVKIWKKEDQESQSELDSKEQMSLF